MSMTTCSNTLRSFEQSVCWHRCPQYRYKYVGRLELTAVIAPKYRLEAWQQASKVKTEMLTVALFKSPESRSDKWLFALQTSVSTSRVVARTKSVQRGRLT